MNYILKKEILLTPTNRKLLLTPTTKLLLTPTNRKFFYSENKKVRNISNTCYKARITQQGKKICSHCCCTGGPKQCNKTRKRNKSAADWKDSKASLMY